MATRNEFHYDSNGNKIEAYPYPLCMHTMDPLDTPTPMATETTPSHKELQPTSTIEDIRPPPITTTYVFPPELLDGEGTLPERTHLSNPAPRQGLGASLNIEIPKEFTSSFGDSGSPCRPLELIDGPAPGGGPCTPTE